MLSLVIAIMPAAFFAMICLTTNAVLIRQGVITTWIPRALLSVACAVFLYTGGYIALRMSKQLESRIHQGNFEIRPRSELGMIGFVCYWPFCQVEASVREQQRNEVKPN